MAGRTTDPNNTGRPLIFRESAYGASNFKIRGTSNFTSAIIPKPKFLFFVRFVKADVNNLNNPNNGVVFQIKEIDKPKVNVKTETLHQYNKPRVIQTKKDYQPMTINFHDDVSEKVMEFWDDYYNFYYGDGGKTGLGDWVNDITSADFHEGLQRNTNGINHDAGWGLRADRTSENMRYLEAIELIQFYGSQFTRMKFINPLINIFDHDSSDYADGQVGTGIRMSFDYEGIIYELEQQHLSKFPGLREEFNFLNGDYFETRTDPTYTAEVPSPQGKKNFDGTTGLTAPNPQQLFSSSKTVLNAVTNANTAIPVGAQAIANGASFGKLGLSNNASLSAIVGSEIGEVLNESKIVQATGVKSAINNFGLTQALTESNVLPNAALTNSGIDSARVNSAAALMSTAIKSSEQVVSDGVTRIVNSTAVNDFSKTFGTAATIAQNTGIVSSISTPVQVLSEVNKQADSFINKLPTGQFTLTDIGATVMNSLRDSTSSLGRRDAENTWNEPNDVDTANRLLSAETGNQTVADQNFNNTGGT